MEKKQYIQPAIMVAYVDMASTLCLQSIQTSNEDAWEDPCAKKNLDDDDEGDGYWQ